MKRNQSKETATERSIKKQSTQSAHLAIDETMDPSILPCIKPPLQATADPSYSAIHSLIKQFISRFDSISIIQCMEQSMNR